MTAPLSSSSAGTVVSIDPVTVEIVRNALVAAADEMSVSLARSAYSPIIYEMKDYSVALFDDECRLLGQSQGLPIFLGALEQAVRVCLDHYGRDSMAPGDIYLINDAYLVGSHLNDMSVFSPIFFDDNLVGFAGSKAHWLDIGCVNPSHTMDSTNIFQEGYRIGPTRIIRAGKMNEELLDMLLRNSRMPRSILGDFWAQVAACRTGEQRYQAVLGRFDRSIVAEAVRQIFEQCERLDRDVVAALPDGTWHAEGFMDSDGAGSGPVKVALTVTIDGSDVMLDLDGSSPQTAGCLNSGLAQTVSAARLAFKFLVNPDVAATGGTFQCLEVRAPRRSIFAAEAPAACQYYYPHSGLMIDLFITLMGEALPDQITAGQCADPMNVLFTGDAEEPGESWVHGEAETIGWGASRDRDGENCSANYGAGDLKNYPVEVVESKYPLRVDEYTMLPDTGGAGRRRGGLAQRRTFTATEDVALSLWLERTVTPAWGVFGGASGSIPTALVTRPDGSEERLLKCSHVPFPAGSRVVVDTGGGGGYGPAAQREAELLAHDLDHGYMTEAGAARDYPEQLAALRAGSTSPEA
jgi:N-methylhydantoinase B